MKKAAMFLAVLAIAGAAFADVLIDASSLAVPIPSKIANFGRVTTPVLITDAMNWRGVVQPGRNVMAKGDTISVIYSRTTSDPSMFQKMYQSYSLDGGLNWTEAELGHMNCMRTYPHQDQPFDAANNADPLGASPHIIWLERLNSGDDTLFFSYDEMVPFQLFTLYPINTGLIAYFPTMCVWGDNLFATASDAMGDDLWGWTSANHGTTWTPVTFRPIGSDAGSVAAIVDNGKDGYAFAYYGIQFAAGRPIYPMFMETTDYGQTWTTEQEFLNIAITDTLGASDTLSVTWQGYSLIVDPDNNMPYIAGKYDYGKDPTSSYNYGEIWFTKPNGGTPGAYTFDANNPVPVFAGDPTVFDHLAGYATISYYKDISGSPVLLIFFDAISQDSMSWQLYCASSLDEGNSWDVQQVTPNDTFYQNDMADASFYVSPTGDVHVAFCNTTTHGDLDPLNYWHISVNVVTDLGLPAVGPYVGVEETPVVEIPSTYRVSAATARGNCSFAVGLPEGGMTSLKVYDATGRMVTEIVNRYLSAGQYRFDWNTGGVPSGNYVYRLTSNGFVTTGKVIVAE